MNKTYRVWTPDDIALAIYARYKGLKYKDIAQLLDTTNSAVSSKMWYYDHSEGVSKTIQSMFNKAGQLEMKVRGGLLPDMRAYWDRRIGEINGVKYNYSDIEVVEEENKPNSFNFSNSATFSNSASNSATFGDPQPSVDLSTILEVRVNLEALNQLMSLLK